MALIDRKIPPDGSKLTLKYNQLIDNELTIMVNQLESGSIIASTDELDEGVSNLYFTNLRSRGAISVESGSSGITYNTTTGVLDFTNLVAGIANLDSFSTDDLVEGTTNKYFASSLARDAISVTGNGTYNSTTGVIDISNASLSVDHISLTSTAGNVDTYTVWGDLAETVNLGTFTVTNGINGEDGSDGESIVATTVTDNLNGTHTVEFFTDLAKTQKVGEVILNDGVDGVDGVSPTVSVLTQAAYDALSPSYDANTFYVING